MKQYFNELSSERKGLLRKGPKEKKMTRTKGTKFWNWRGNCVKVQIKSWYGENGASDTTASVKTHCANIFWSVSTNHRRNLRPGPVYPQCHSETRSRDMVLLWSWDQSESHLAPLWSPVTTKKKGPQGPSGGNNQENVTVKPLFFSFFPFYSTLWSHSHSTDEYTHATYMQVHQKSPQECRKPGLAQITQ